MTTKTRWFLSLLLAFILVILPTVMVFAKEISFLTIRGPGIKGEIMINEPEAMHRLLETGILFGEFSSAQAPDDPGEGYHMFAYLYLDGPTVPFVELTYYPPLEGQPGFVHYLARLNNEGTKLAPVDDWHEVPSSIVERVYEVFAGQGVLLQPIALSISNQGLPAQSGADPEQDPASLKSSLTAWLLAAVWLPMAALIGFILKRLNVKPRQSTVS